MCRTRATNINIHHVSDAVVSAGLSSRYLVSITGCNGFIGGEAIIVAVASRDVAAITGLSTRSGDAGVPNQDQALAVTPAVVTQVCLRTDLHIWAIVALLGLPLAHLVTCHRTFLAAILFFVGVCKRLHSDHFGIEPPPSMIQNRWFDCPASIAQITHLHCKRASQVSRKQTVISTCKKRVQMFASRGPTI